MRILGIDYGSARVGVALGDTETRVASPWRVIANEDVEETIDRLGEIAKQERAEKFVVGMPRPLADQLGESDQTREVKVFIERLARLSFPIEEENETLSSALAAKQAKEMGETKKRDDLAATVILQGWLDRYELSS
ncbi:Holliday junction resolvase RuvX [Candidatus Uhrbacteria bacterium]|nr:Holliday junction resolvase RuvX [Candidatus Uhrbacteria bacterium]